jgi:predicted nucleic acid-binding protein
VSVAYLDSSALVKLVTREPESAALRKHLRPLDRRISSVLARAEVLRTARILGRGPLRVARAVLRRMELVSIDPDLLERAAFLDPPTLRTLDAIHLATALLMGDQLSEVVTYDQRMIDAAEVLGVQVASPR